jgi:hypothetical protein
MIKLHKNLDEQQKLEERKKYKQAEEKNLTVNQEQQQTMTVFEQEQSFVNQSTNHDLSIISSSPTSSGNYSRSNTSNEQDSPEKLNISQSPSTSSSEYYLMAPPKPSINSAIIGEDDLTNKCIAQDLDYLNKVKPWCY